MTTKSKLIRKFDKQAKMYTARTIQGRERDWRQRLIREAAGDVLEVACGAGANFPFYPYGVQVTAVDFSEAMLQGARQHAQRHGVHAEFRSADVETLDFPPNAFDTIVSTLSFCGYERPDKMLEAFNRWCKPGGKILMMEHGLGKRKLVRAAQRAFDPLFRRMSGCHLDRDILSLLQNSPLQITNLERHMLGAVFLVWAKPGETH